MTTPLLGDPASLSALAGSLRRTAAQLAADADDLDSALADAARGCSSPRSMSLRRSVEAAASQTGRIAAALDEVGGSLQTAATDLAAAIAHLRELEEAARTAGLEVRDGSVTGGWGIAGLADAGAALDGDRLRERLQERIHGAVTTLGRQRARSTADCVRARRLLQEASATPRGDRRAPPTGLA